MSLFAKLLGTTLSKFQLGLGGPQLKNNAGVVEARNAADSAYAAIAASLLSLYGNDFVLNAGAAGSGADWTFKVSRPSTGMTQNIQVIWPGAAPSPNMVLSVVSFAAGVITLQWAAAGGGSAADKIGVDSTSIAFGSTSPLAMFTLPANAVIAKVQVIVDTPFNGAPSLSVGVSGTTSKYMGSTDIDLTAAAGTVFEVAPGLGADGSSESLIATYAAGSASAGAGRILVNYAIPT